MKKDKKAQGEAVKIAGFFIILGIIAVVLIFIGISKNQNSQITGQAISEVSDSDSDSSQDSLKKKNSKQPYTVQVFKQDKLLFEYDQDIEPCDIHSSFFGELCKKTGKKIFTIDNMNVNLDFKKDFQGGPPQYDWVYCNKKFKEQEGYDPDYCYIDYVSARNIAGTEGIISRIRCKCWA